MTDSFTLLLVLTAAGACGGFISSTPLGVINLWIVHSSIERRRESVRWFVSGVISADVAYAAIAAWGYHVFVQDGPVGRSLELVGGTFLVVLGVLNLRQAWTKRTPSSEAEAVRGNAANAPRIRKPGQDFALGAFMCGSNPVFLMFWVYVIKQVEDHLAITLSKAAIIAFLCGIALGDSLWFRLLTFVVSRSRTAVRPRVLRYVSSGIAVAFVGFGLVALMKSVIP